MATRIPIALLLLVSAAALISGCGTSGRGGGGDPRDPPTPPTLSSVSPPAGFDQGGTLVTIRGTDFTDPTEVEFDGVPGTAVTLVDATMLTCRTPPGVAGAAQVAVRTAAGSSPSSAFTYVAYPPSAALDAQVDAEGAPAPAGSAAHPAICCDGSNIYVAWPEARADPSLIDVFFQRSTDRGRTWLPTDIRLNTNAPGSSHAFGLEMCCSGGNLYVAWFDDRNEVFTPFVNCSQDGGVTWRAADIGLSSVEESNMTFLKMCCAGDNVHVCWADRRDLRGAILVNSSTDAGVTWLDEEVQLSTWVFTPEAPNLMFSFGQPLICCGESSVCVSWPDNRTETDYDLWCRCSTDGGQTWTPDARVDRDTMGRNTTYGLAQYRHAMCCDGQRVYVAWPDDRNAPAQFVSWDVYANTSTDGGLTWGATDFRVNAADLAAPDIFMDVPRVACEGTHLHVVWIDERNGVRNVFYNGTADAGATFRPQDERLDVGGTGVVTGPFAACGQGNVHVTWTDERTPGQTDVFCSSSADHGTTWLAGETRLDSDVPNPGASLLSRVVGGGGAVSPICCDGVYPYVVWRDDRHAPAAAPPMSAAPIFDIFFGTYE